MRDYQHALASADDTLAELIAERRAEGKTVRTDDLAAALLLRWQFSPDMHQSAYWLCRKAAADIATTMLQRR